jgi:hypothetical protein
LEGAAPDESLDRSDKSSDATADPPRDPGIPTAIVRGTAIAITPGRNRGIRKMIRVTGALRFFILVGAVGAGAGCASFSGGRGGGHDLHATARITGDASRLVVSGPAVLLHVDVDGRDDMALYAVARKDGTAADCAGGPIGARRQLRPGVANRVNLAVAADETICVAAAPSKRSGSVMWHARLIDGGAGAASGAAIAFDAADR